MSVRPTCLAGQIFEGEGFFEGHVLVEGGIVSHVGQGPPPETPSLRGIVLPSLVNAHTHVGDMFLRGRAIPRDLQAAVAPPDGLKHRALREAAPEVVESGIGRAIEEMEAAGVGLFADFREGGVEGVEMLGRSLKGRWPDCVSLGRPAGGGYDKEEVDAILERCGGIAVSSLADHEFPVLEKLSSRCRSAGKTFALHASEASREDIDKVLELRPDFLVHMNHASAADLERVASAGVPVILCPRSNAHFTRPPDLVAFLEAGVTLGLGTDNAMLNSGDVLEEARLLAHIAPQVDGTRLLRMVTTEGRKALRPTAVHNPIHEGLPADFVVLAISRPDPMVSLFDDKPRLIGRVKAEESRWKNTKGS